MTNKLTCKNNNKAIAISLKKFYNKKLYKSKQLLKIIIRRKLNFSFIKIEINN